MHGLLDNLQVGLVLNFGMERMKDGIVRIVNGLPEEEARAETLRARRKAF